MSTGPTTLLIALLVRADGQLDLHWFVAFAWLAIALRAAMVGRTRGHGFGTWLLLGLLLGPFALVAALDLPKLDLSSRVGPTKG